MFIHKNNNSPILLQNHFYDNYMLLRVCYVPDTVLDTLYTLSHPILIPALGDSI